MKNGGRAYTLPPLSIIKIPCRHFAATATIAASVNDSKSLIYIE